MIPAGFRKPFDWAVDTGAGLLLLVLWFAALLVAGKAQNHDAVRLLWATGAAGGAYGLLCFLG